MAVQTRKLESDQKPDVAAQLQALQSAFETSEKKVYQQALEASERRYRDLFDSVLTGVYRVTPDGLVALANPALQRMLGYELTEQPVIQRLDQAQFEAGLLNEGQVRGLEGVWIRKDGHYITVRETARVIKDSRGTTLFYEGVVEDITAEKRSELFDRGCRRVLEMVARNEPLNDILCHIGRLLETSAPVRKCVVSLRENGRLYPIPNCSSPSNQPEGGMPLRAGYGCSAHAVHSRRTVVVPNVAESELYVHVRDLAMQAGLASAWSTPISSHGEVQGTITAFSFELMSPDEQELRMIETASRLAAVAIEHRWLYDNLHRQATKDSLTGLPNRSVFEETLALSIRENAEIALLWIDLDRFKEVNDTLGHRVGDALIRQVAARLSECAGKTTLLARIGGDEFAIILHPHATRRDAERCAQHIAAALQSAFEVEEYELFVTASIGICMYPEHAHTAAELQQKADAAMYRAKSRGKNGYAFFEEQLERGARERLEMETSLRRALHNGEMKLFFQPQVDLNGRLLGMEALLRWQHPKRGILAPGEFIAIAEETGLIVPIGSWVIREACRQISEWRACGMNVKVAVNVSALQFYFSDLLEIVREALSAYGLPADCLELELTESLIMRNLEDSGRELERLRELGVSVAIDDFGTGYSSLSYLQKLPVDCLKIDRSFVQDIDVMSTAALVQAITQVAHSLGLTVVAEGVETECQLDGIRKVGVDVAQGYLFGRPMPSEGATEYLQASMFC